MKSGFQCLCSLFGVFAVQEANKFFSIYGCGIHNSVLLVDLLICTCELEWSVCSLSASMGTIVTCLLYVDGYLMKFAVFHIFETPTTL